MAKRPKFEGQKADPAFVAEIKAVAEAHQKRGYTWISDPGEPLAPLSRVEGPWAEAWAERMKRGLPPVSVSTRLRGATR